MPEQITTSPGTASLLAICERRGVPLAVLDGTGGLRILCTASDLRTAQRKGIS